MKKVKKDENGGESKSDIFMKFYRKATDEEEQLLDEIRIKRQYWKTGTPEQEEKIRERLLMISKEERLPVIKMVAQLYGWSPEAHDEIYKFARMLFENISNQVKILYDNTKQLIDLGISSQASFSFTKNFQSDTEVRKIAENIKILKEYGANADIAFSFVKESPDVVRIKQVSEDIKVLRNGGVSTKYATAVSIWLADIKSRVTEFEKIVSGLAEAEKSGIPPLRVARFLIGLVDEDLINEFNKNPAELMKRTDDEWEQLFKRINFKSHFLDRRSSELKNDIVLSGLHDLGYTETIPVMKMIAELCEMSRSGGYLKDMRDVFNKISQEQRERHKNVSDDVKRIHYATKRLDEVDIKIKDAFYFIYRLPDFSTTDRLIKYIEIVRLTDIRPKDVFSTSERLLDTPEGNQMVRSFETLKSGLSANYAASILVALALEGYPRDLWNMSEGISKADREKIPAKKIVEFVLKVKNREAINEFNKNPKEFINRIDISAQKLKLKIRTENPQEVVTEIAYERGLTKAEKIVDLILEIHDGKLVYPPNKKIEVNEATAYKIYDLYTKGLDLGLATHTALIDDQLAEGIIDAPRDGNLASNIVRMILFHYSGKEEIRFWLGRVEDLNDISKKVSSTAVPIMMDVINDEKELKNFWEAFRILSFHFNREETIQVPIIETYRIQLEATEGQYGKAYRNWQKIIGYTDVDINYKDFFTRQIVEFLSAKDVPREKRVANAQRFIEERKSEIEDSTMNANKKSIYYQPPEEWFRGTSYHDTLQF